MANRKSGQKTIVVLGVKLLEYQVVVEEALSAHNVRFVATPLEAVVACIGADVLALHTDHEVHVCTFRERGFKGPIIPLLGGNKKAIRINGNLVPAVSIRELPGKVNEALAVLARSVTPVPLAPATTRAT